MDSDKDKKGARINETKERLRDEFDLGPGHAWITAGREIENYLHAENVKNSILKIHPKAKCKSTFGSYENTLLITTKSGKASQASKVEIANYIVENFEADFSQLDLKKQVQKQRMTTARHKAPVRSPNP